MKLQVCCVLVRELCFVHSVLQHISIEAILVFASHGVIA